MPRATSPMRNLSVAAVIFTAVIGRTTWAEEPFIWVVVPPEKATKTTYYAESSPDYYAESSPPRKLSLALLPPQRDPPGEPAPLGETPPPPTPIPGRAEDSSSPPPELPAPTADQPPPSDPYPPAFIMREMQFQGCQECDPVGQNTYGSYCSSDYCQDAPLGECPANPARSFPAIAHGPLLDMLAVDIARRSLLAVHPEAGYRPIITEEVLVRRQGHYVRTYARLRWYKKHLWQKGRNITRYQSEVSASIVYHPERRRVTDLSYIDNAFLTFRNIDRASQVVATYNEDFSLRDDVGIPAKVLSQNVNVLQPTRNTWTS